MVSGRFSISYFFFGQTYDLNFTKAVWGIVKAANVFAAQGLASAQSRLVHWFMFQHFHTFNHPGSDLVNSDFKMQ